MRFINLINGLLRVRPKLDRDQIQKNPFASAAILARRRKYTEASQQLQLALDHGHCSESEALDLQARIYVQQGMYLHAESYWRRAQSMDSDNPKYEEALMRLRQERSPIFCLGRMVVGVCLVGVVSLMWWKIASLGRMVERNQCATLESIGAYQTEVCTAGNITRQQEESLSHSFSGLNDQLQDFRSVVTNRFELVPTAESQATLIGRLESRLATLSEITERTSRDLDLVTKTQEETITGHDVSFEHLDNVLTQLFKTVSQMSSVLATQQEDSVSIQRQATEDVSTALVSIQKEITRLASIVEQTKTFVEEDAASLSKPSAQEKKRSPKAPIKTGRE